MNKTIRFSKALPLALVAGALLVVSIPSHATLGETEQTVQADQIQMKARLRPSAGVVGSYSMHQMETPAGTIVKEYAEPGGRIFAVTWKGPVIPDLRQLLGRHFNTYANSRSATRGGHAHVAVAQSGVVVRSQGRMRAFSGTAYIPGLVPAGVSIEDLP